MAIAAFPGAALAPAAIRATPSVAALTFATRTVAANAVAALRLAPGTTFSRHRIGRAVAPPTGQG